MKALKKFASACVDPQLVPTAFKVALFVGSILFTINHGSALVKGNMTRERMISGLLTGHTSTARRRAVSAPHLSRSLQCEYSWSSKYGSKRKELPGKLRNEEQQSEPGKQRPHKKQKKPELSTIKHKEQSATNHRTDAKFRFCPC
ncbi:hypothetical protein H1P_630004 [Hyella patelloides LEGE 07179]|uniref:Uncharacterized protein n=1 Tax=Hyella patelloides LEGE 07179 TaxID=945734 RepID=A0A563W1U5_9CYAN|nr:nitrate/nitrite transporter NrtS [Hyella patelloides]VEP17607.1 hypothetical protein H1P_630004 [Hyella patelloides LEGE 07179]